MTKLAMPFDNPTTYAGHSGVDFGEAERTPIKASGPGKVNFAGYVNDRAGWGVIVEFDAFPDIEFLYCHMPEFGTRPKANSRFVLGGFLGTVGQTGRRSTGPHLHVEALNGPGAHTYSGTMQYFDRNRVVGDGSTAGSIINALVKEDEVFVANVKHGNRQGVFLVVPNGSGLSKAVALTPGSDPKGFPTVTIDNFSDSFWKTVELV